MKIEKYQTALILNDLIINNIKQVDISNKYGVSKSYISQVSRKVLSMKYKPKIVNNQIVCLECGKISNPDGKNRLVIHHDHNTGQSICILCPSCNKKVGNKTIFNGDLNEIMVDNSYGKNLANRICIRLTQEQYEWYSKFASLENVTISELFRKLPEKYDSLDVEVDKLNEELIKLKNKNI